MSSTLINKFFSSISAVPNNNIIKVNDNLITDIESKKNVIIFLTDSEIDNNNGFAEINLPIVYSFYDINTNSIIETNKLYISSNGFFSFMRINTLDYKLYGNIPDSTLLRLIQMV